MDTEAGATRYALTVFVYLSAVVIYGVSTISTAEIEALNM